MWTGEKQKQRRKKVGKAGKAPQNEKKSIGRLKWNELDLEESMRRGGIRAALIPHHAS